MTTEVEATGATVEEAIDRALAELGAREDEVEIQVLVEGGAPKGILGRRVEQAKVRVRLRDERTPEEIAAAAHAAEPPPDEDLLEDQADAAEDFLNGLLDVLDMDGEAAADIEEEAIMVRMSGPEMGLLIGRHGATLEALQELVRAAVQHETESRVRINLDIEGYRDRQRGMLTRRARAAADEVRKSGRAMALEPMSSFERKIVHSALTDFAGVTTASEGEEPSRRVVINPV